MKMTDFPYPECDPGTVLRENKRYFGDFECDNCDRWWQSGNSWLGFGQDCTGCGELTFPWKLSYLELPPKDANGIEKRHPQEKCERCRDLGSYCRESNDVKVQHNRTRRTNPTKSSALQPKSYSGNPTMATSWAKEWNECKKVEKSTKSSASKTISYLTTTAKATPSKKDEKSTRSLALQTRTYSAKFSEANLLNRFENPTKSSSSNSTSYQTVVSSPIVSYPTTSRYTNLLPKNENNSKYKDNNYYDPPPAYSSSSPSSAPKSSNSSGGFGFWTMTFVTAAVGSYLTYRYLTKMQRQESASEWLFRKLFKNHHLTNSLMDPIERIVLIISLVTSYVSNGGSPSIFD